MPAKASIAGQVGIEPRAHRPHEWPATIRHAKPFLVDSDQAICIATRRGLGFKTETGNLGAETPLEILPRHKKHAHQPLDQISAQGIVSGQFVPAYDGQPLGGDPASIVVDGNGILNETLRQTRDGRSPERQQGIGGIRRVALEFRATAPPASASVDRAK